MKSRQNAGWERRRFKAIELAKRGDLTRQDVAEQLGVARSTLQKWLAKYEASGGAALRDKGRIGPSKTLTPEAEKAVLSRVVNVPPGIGARRKKYYQEDVGWTWSWETVQKLIEGGTKKRLSRNSVIRYLQSWGMWPRPRGLSASRHLRDITTRENCTRDPKAVSIQVISPTPVRAAN